MPARPTLAEHIKALPAERYRVEKYLVADPADIDGDCIDDIAELADPVGMNPVNGASAVALVDGSVAIPDRATLTALSETSSVRFVVFDHDTDRPRLDFVNGRTHHTHYSFMQAVRPQETGREIKGRLTHHPEIAGPDGTMGIFSYWTEATRPFTTADRMHTCVRTLQGARYQAGDALQVRRARRVSCGEQGEKVLASTLAEHVLDLS